MPVPILQRHSLLLLSPEPDSSAATDQYNTLRRGTPFLFTSSAATSTTVVSASLSSAEAWSYLGCLLEAVDGNVAGQMRRITGFVPATDTATVTPAFDVSGVATAPTGTTWRLWVPPEPILASDSAGAGDGTTIVAEADADESGRPGRDEAASYWSSPTRYLAVGYGGGNANRAAQITADGAAGGGAKTFTVEGSVLAATAAGELFIPRLPFRQFGGEFNLPSMAQAYIPRAFVKSGADWDAEPGVLGPKRGGTLTLTGEVQRLSAASSGATAAVPPAELHDLLASLATYDTDAATAIVAGGAVGTLRVTEGDGWGGAARFNIGGAVLVNGELAWIVDAAEADAAAYDTLSVSPALSAYPAVGLAVNGGANYSPRTSGFRSWTVENWIGGGPGRATAYGWLPSFRLEGLTEGELLRVIFEGPYDSFFTDTSSLPTWTTSAGGRLPTWTQVLPMQARAVRFSLSHTAGTFSALTIRGFTFNANLSPVMREAITGYAHDGAFVEGLAGGAPTGTITIDVESLAQLERFQAGRQLEMTLQVGAAAGATFGLWARRIELTEVATSADAGRIQQVLTYRVLASGLTGNDTDGAGTVAVPAYVLSFC